MKAKILIALGVIFVIALIYFAGYGTGKSNIKVIHDTTQVVDTLVKTDSFYQQASIDTIFIRDTLYTAAFSEYFMHRGGYAKTWYIPRRDEFKWEVKEPKPLVITNIKYEQVKVPTLDLRSSLIIGIIGIIGGFIGGILIK